VIDLRRNFEFEDIMLINFANLTDEEKEMVRKWRNNERIRKWMYSKHIISTEEHTSFIERLKDDLSNFYWLSKVGPGKYIGVIYLNRLDLINKHAYLGIYKNPDCKISGAGLLLMGCLKSLAFDVANLQTLKLEVMSDNYHAIRFYKQTGFQEEGKRCNLIIMSARKKRRQSHGF
jgi:UDP-4-amino-4,6-dideoxy-N-acetyl-beta-L-altrosamine N-acetyltransferase